MLLAVIADTRSAERDLALHGAIVQLRTVRHLNDPGGMADSRQGFVSDLHSNWIQVLQVQTIPHLATFILAVCHFKLALEKSALAVARGLDLGLHHHDVVPA
jgi:hypothetical protein